MTSRSEMPELRTAQRWGHLSLFLLVICFAGLGARLAYIHTAMNDKLLTYRSAQQTSIYRLPARRGSIYDTSGRLLAASETRSSVYADPHLVIDLEDTCSRLSAVLGKPAEELASRIRKRRESRFVWLARKIAATDADAVAAMDLPGIRLRDEAVRFYPNGSALAHLLGFVNSECEGLEGLELRYNKVLSGQAGVYQTWCDTRRRPLWTQQADSMPAVNGQDLILTIDLVIQSFLEEVLARAVDKFQAESAVGIVLSPQTGDILAMACNPTFDPNFRNDYPADHRRNRCITDPVEPGSCFKPIIMSAALAEGLASLDERIDCGSGVWYFGRRRIRDTHANGMLTFEEVLVHSSNIGMGHIGTRMGNRLLHEYLGHFGFGQRTGVDLPGESAGIVLPLRRWTSYSKTSIPIGQELAVTPLQLISAFAALSNGGVLIQPRVVRALVDPAGQRTAMPDHARSVRQVIPPPIAAAVAQRTLVRMVNDSPHDIKLARYQVLGKTGTAQVPYSNRRGYEPDAYLGSFLGAAPAHDPVVATLVMIRKPNRKLGYYGGKVAGPAVKEVIEKTLAYWDIPPDRPNPIDEPITVAQHVN